VDAADAGARQPRGGREHSAQPFAGRRVRFRDAVVLPVTTILGSTDKAIEIVRALPFAAKTTLVQWEMKLLVLCMIFIYAFFKFIWALR
jgi:uncharacterized membrane protein